MSVDSRSRSRFSGAPQSVTSLVAALLGPLLAVLSYAALLAWHGRPMAPADLMLCLLAFLLSFPGRNRFWTPPLTAAGDIALHWTVLLAVLAVCGQLADAFGHFDRGLLLAWALLAPLLEWSAFRLGGLLLARLAPHFGGPRAAVVVGAGALGVKVAQALQEHRRVAQRFEGYFDDRVAERTDPAARSRRLGGLADLAAYVQQRGVGAVYITLPLGSQPRIAQLLARLQETTASVYFVPDVFGTPIIQGRLHDMNGVPVVGLCETPFTGINGLAKRVCDVLLASAILLLIAPLLAAIALGVKLSSPGPVIFKQRRNGLDGEEIVVWKFRSMRTQDDGAVVRQATRGDARITPFGAFLRRTSLDELPQFLNVLQGQMSIVGPRPHAVAHNEMYRELIRAYTVRHKVKPGITGWAQVNGLRGETDTVDKMRARVEYDLEYLRNWTLGLDLRIVARTVRLLFFDRNAY
jgi:putative colanic acid biosysnthesis UDP-glucose lipid carrier transferase